ncbi:hypothetical protein BHE74_00015815 [Ensete ventricosum]|nr:hypothetical protein BHE74_00015815 [Ensete ventricosum]RZS24605.1 hypothetical protein BHM03_00057691 [Ensete ventricosum]
MTTIRSEGERRKETREMGRLLWALFSPLSIAISYSVPELAIAIKKPVADPKLEWPRVIKRMTEVVGTCVRDVAEITSRWIDGVGVGSHFVLSFLLGGADRRKRGVAMRGARRPIHALAGWVRRQPPKVKAFLGVVAGMAALVFLRFIVHDHDNLFVAAEAVHAIGISVLIYKLSKERTCAGAHLSHSPLILWFILVHY